MTFPWILCVDETKDDGRIAAIGVLVVQHTVAPQARAVLEKERARFEDEHNITVGELKWTKLKSAAKAALTGICIERYLQAPLMFFITVRAADDEHVSRFDLVKRAVIHLEGNPRVPGGLTRGRTTLILDHDDLDSRTFEDEAAAFGLMFAEESDSRSDPLLQLADVLLGIANREYEGRKFGNTPGERHRAEVFAHTQDRYDHYGKGRKKNWIFALEAGGIVRPLLELGAAEAPTSPAGE